MAEARSLRLSSASQLARPGLTFRYPEVVRKPCVSKSTVRRSAFYLLQLLTVKILRHLSGAMFCGDGKCLYAWISLYYTPLELTTSLRTLPSSPVPLLGLRSIFARLTLRVDHLRLRRTTAAFQPLFGRVIPPPELAPTVHLLRCRVHQLYGHARTTWVTI